MDCFRSILENTKKCLIKRKNELPFSFLKSHRKPSAREFKKALLADKINIIAEIKKASPIKGILRDYFDHKALFRAYKKYAAAVSVITEEKFFHGNLSFLSDLDTISNLPLLRKDFIIDEYQIYESRFYGADALLLIAKILTLDELKHFQTIARQFNMASLVEIHDEDDMQKATSAGSEIIGVNARNLNDFTISLDFAKKILSLIPSSIIRILESGIHSHEDIVNFLPYTNNFLIGSCLVSADDPEKKLRSFINV